MSRTSLTRRPVRAVLALTVGAASLVGLGQASAAPAAAVTYTITGVSPAYVEAGTGEAFGITISGKGFTRRTRVQFGDCGTVASVAPSTLTATKLVVQPPSCAAGPVDLSITGDGVTPSPATTLAGKFAFLAKPVVAAVAPATGPWSGGTAATVTVTDPVPAKAPVQVWLTSAGVTKPVAGKVDAANARRISFKVPPGVPGGQPSVAVSVFGVMSEPLLGQFTWVSTIKTTPAVYVKDAAAAPSVKIDGAGFLQGPLTVRICGVVAAPVTGKPATDKTVVVTAPSWAAVAAATGATVDATAGGVCTVQVTAGSQTSVVTAGSTFTYAAY